MEAILMTGMPEICMVHVFHLNWNWLFVSFNYRSVEVF
jgi:hypothetical protein